MLCAFSVCALGRNSSWITIILLFSEAESVFWCLQRPGCEIRSKHRLLFSLSSTHHSRPVPLLTAKRVRTLLLSDWKMQHFPSCRCVGKEKNGDCEQMYERLFISDAGLDCTRGCLNNALAFRDSCFVVWMLYELVYCDLRVFRDRWSSGNGTGIRHVCARRTGGHRREVFILLLIVTGDSAKADMFPWHHSSLWKQILFCLGPWQLPSITNK